MSLKTIFLTGASGALGSSIVPFLMELNPSRVYLLLRAESDEKLAERFNDLLAYWDFNADVPTLIPVRGDITEDGFGINPTIFKEIIHSITHIIHCAATVKMNMTEEQAHRSSVRSTENLLQLADLCLQNGTLEKIEYISTVGIAGKMPGSIPETPLITPRAFHNTYESSKTKAEELVLQKINIGWPITIHRPSMVVGDSITGKTIHFQIFYHLTDFLTGKYTAGFLPQIKNVKLDTVPSDYVAKVIVWSTQQTSTIGKILHLTSGPGQSIEIQELAKKVQEFYKSKNYAIPTTRLVPLRLFKFLLFIFSIFSNIKNKKKLQNLSMFLEFIADKQVFENKKTRRILDIVGVPLPKADTYLGNVLDFYHVKKQPDHIHTIKNVKLK
ncbi:MAG: SDR family oxidoreductase [Bacteroidetes bacterium]|nr:SDR family oxidoreductase [Bacteroidota bacterium]